MPQEGTEGKPKVSAFRAPNPKTWERLFLTFFRSRVILRPRDFLVAIGVPAEKEVIL